MPELFLFLAEALIVATAVAALVMGLALFFRWLPRFGPRPPGLHLQEFGDLFETGRSYDLLLVSGHRLTGLRFEGLVRLGAEADLPFAVRSLAVLRRPDGGKVILRIDSVRVFEEVARAPATGPGQEGRT